MPNSAELIPIQAHRKEQESDGAISSLSPAADPSFQYLSITSTYVEFCHSSGKKKGLLKLSKALLCRVDAIHAVCHTRVCIPVNKHTEVATPSFTPSPDQTALGGTTGLGYFLRAAIPRSQQLCVSSNITARTRGQKQLFIIYKMTTII